MTDELRLALEQAGYEKERFFRMVYVGTYTVLAIATFIYQGLMTLYYARRREAVERALDGEEESPRFN